MNKSPVSSRFITPKNLVILLFSLFVIFSLVNTALLANLSGLIVGKRELEKEKLRPAKIEVTSITLSDCEECYEIDNALEDLKKQNVNIIKEETFDYKSRKGKQLIKLYDIEKLPALIIKGETNKTEQLTLYWNHVGEQKGDNYETVIYTNIVPPYYDRLDGRIIGRVSVTSLVDSSCIGCVSLEGIVKGFEQAGVKVVERKTVEYKSDEGKQLVDKFKVKEIPALIVSKDILDYDAVKQIWNQLNATEKEGFFALHSKVPPYIDVVTGNVIGLVTLITLNDTTCDKCYDVSINKFILPRFGIAVDKEFSYDVKSPEGKELINKYNITKIPIIILSPDAKSYTAFTQAWPEVGSVENDGWYIMRNPELLGTYKNLVTNKIVEDQRR